MTLKIVPMLNPDGVFIGNYRTGIIGDDFNRKFHSGRKEYYPEIFALKKLVSSCKKIGNIELFIDLHGHSVLKNSFIYGPNEHDFAKSKRNNLLIFSKIPALQLVSVFEVFQVGLLQIQKLKIEY